MKNINKWSSFLIVFFLTLGLNISVFAQSFKTSDLAGTWYGYVSETNSEGATYWIYGFFTIDSSGNITGGTYNAPDGSTVTVTGGQTSLDTNGIMTGQLIAEGGLTSSFPHGKMDSNKTMISFIGADNLGSLDIGVAIKGGGGVTAMPWIPLLLLDD